MQRFLVAAVVLIALGAPALGEQQDAGAQLASALGLNDPLEAQRAVDELATAQRLGLASGADDAPVNEDLLARHEAESTRASSLEPQKALPVLTMLTKDLDAELKVSRSTRLANAAVRAHLDRASALKQLNKPIEALVEAQKARSLCLRLAQCASAQMNANNVIHSIEDELKVKGDYAVFGLPDGASLGEVGKARKSLMLLVHPDKNSGADKQSANYLKHLYHTVETAFANISGAQQ